MPLEDILVRIRAQAQAAAARVIAEAEESAETRLQAAREEADSAAASIVDRASLDAQKAMTVAEGRAQTLYRQMVLQEKQELVSQVFDEALKKLSGLPVDEYRNLLMEAILGVASGREELVLGSDDCGRMGQEFLDSLNRELKRRGKAGEVTLSYAREPFGGGFVLQKEGIATNVTFPAILRKVFDDLEIEVARILFE